MLLTFLLPLFLIKLSGKGTPSFLQPAERPLPDPVPPLSPINYQILG